MKQVIQSLADGTIEVIEVPSPAIRRGHLLVETTASLVSPGTERMLLEFGRSGWVERARQQPDKVRQVVEKIRTDGLLPTIEAVRSKLAQPFAPGYCNVGRVIAVGDGVSGFTVGDRVLSNGAHAEVVRVPKNLAARIPDNVTDDAAAFGVLGAIALQGVRLAEPTLGETVAVVGVGMIGLLAVQLLRANGCRVIALDFDEARLAMARRFGAVTVNPGAGEDAVQISQGVTAGIGVDAVLLCAATDSSEPVSLAARMSRQRGRIVLVGVTGLELSRADFYEKELTFQVSCSYGPGRYDPAYEERGEDYPVGHVRWTEQRNFTAVLQAMEEKRLNVEPLITHRFDLARAAEAYEALAGGGSALGILLGYGNATQSEAKRARVISLSGPHGPARSEAPGIAFLGAGNYATRVLAPLFAKADCRLTTICNSGSIAATVAGKKFGFVRSTSAVDAVFDDGDTDAVVIATRHGDHAAQVLAALNAGKDVFVEKPLAISHGDVDRIEAALTASPQRVLTVGFNRRFAQLAQRLKSMADGAAGPKCVVYTACPGAIPGDHWSQDSAEGGGRIIGEACHFIDFLRWLIGARICGWTAAAASAGGSLRDDCATLTFQFEDGSLGTVHYFANGGRAFPKERVEVFAGDAALQLDNFAALRGFGWRGFRRASSWAQDKGQPELVGRFVASIRDRKSLPIPIDEILEVARVAIDCGAALRPGIGARHASSRD